MKPNSITSEAKNGLSVLRRFTRRSPSVERCDLCSRELSAGHRHLLEVAARKVFCACDPCALRFENVIAGRFKLIPRDTRPLLDFRISDAQWDSLALPINLAFVFHNSVAEKTTAMYPSPAGATESMLPLEHWGELARQNPALQQLQPDVEALLVNRVGSARNYFIAPIDVCYELVGIIRKNWRGLSGGEGVWRKITEFFARLNQSTVAAAPSREVLCA